MAIRLKGTLITTKTPRVCPECAETFSEGTKMHCVITMNESELDYDYYCTRCFSEMSQKDEYATKYYIGEE